MLEVQTHVQYVVYVGASVNAHELLHRQQLPVCKVLVEQVQYRKLGSVNLKGLGLPVELAAEDLFLPAETVQHLEGDVSLVLVGAEEALDIPLLSRVSHAVALLVALDLAVELEAVIHVADLEGLALVVLGGRIRVVGVVCGARILELVGVDGAEVLDLED